MTTAKPTYTPPLPTDVDLPRFRCGWIYWAAGRSIDECGDADTELGYWYASTRNDARRGDLGGALSLGPYHVEQAVGRLGPYHEGPPIGDLFDAGRVKARRGSARSQCRHPAELAGWDHEHEAAILALLYDRLYRVGIERIGALHAEAGAAGDVELARSCQVAIGHVEATTDERLDALDAVEAALASAAAMDEAADEDKVVPF